MRKKFTNQSGQTIVIILLVMVVILTIGLSITARSITDLRLSSTTEQSSRAFSAAEAGIEEALQKGLTGLPSATNVSLGTGGASYSYNVSPLGGTGYVPDKPIQQDTVIQLNLSMTGVSNPATAFNLYWVDKANSAEVDNSASMEITFVSGTTTYTLEKYAYNVDAGRSNGFDSPSSFDQSYGGKTYRAKVSLTIPANAQVVRIRPLYNNASLAIEAQPSGKNLPTQSFKVTAVGTAGGATRKIEVTQSVSALPAVFDFVLFSGQDITK